MLTRASSNPRSSVPLQDLVTAMVYAFSPSSQTITTIALPAPARRTTSMRYGDGGRIASGSRRLSRRSMLSWRVRSAHDWPQVRASRRTVSMSTRTKRHPSSRSLLGLTRVASLRISTMSFPASTRRQHSSEPARPPSSNAVASSRPLSWRSSRTTSPCWSRSCARRD